MRILTIPTLLIVTLSLVPTTASPLLFYVTQYDPVCPRFPIKPLAKKGTTFSCGMVRHQGQNAYSATGSSVPFLEMCGTANLADIYNGLTPKAGGISEQYFTADGAQSLLTLRDGDPIQLSLRFNDKKRSYLFQSYHLALTHFFFSDLFFLGCCRFIDQELEQPVTASGSGDVSHPYVQSLLNSFDAFLIENSHPPVTRYHHHISLEQCGFFFGWAKHSELKGSILKGATGSVLAGYSFAPTHFEDPLAPAFLLHSINHSYSAQAELNLQLDNHFAIDSAASVTIYERLTGSMPVVRDDLQPQAPYTYGTPPASFYAGPVLLGRGTVLKDPGNLWVFDIALVANNFYGFFISGGYHFAYQETTRLTIKDTTILQGTGDGWTSLTKLGAQAGQQNTRLNADPRLQNWKHHSVFIKGGFAPTSKRALMPAIEAAVYFPVMGHRSVSPSRIYTGNAELSIRWTF